MMTKKTELNDRQSPSKIAPLETVTSPYIPSAKWLDLRTVNRGLAKLVDLKKSYKKSENRVFENAGYELDSVFTDPLGAAAQITKDGLLAGKSVLEIIKDLQNKHIKISKDKLSKALLGELHEGQRIIIQTYQDIIKQLDDKIASLTNYIINEVQNLESKNFMLLQTIPGFDQRSAAIFLTEVGGHEFLDTFANEDRFSSWVGVSPKKNEITDNDNSSTSRKGNIYLIHTMCEVAEIASQIKGTAFKSKYNSLRKRMVHERIIFIIAHKLTRVAYKILAKGEPYIEMNTK